eukprot:s811_g10.t1
MGLDEVRTLEVLIFEDETSGSKREAGLGLEIQTQTCALASVLVAIMIPRCQCHDQQQRGKVGTTSAQSPAPSPTGMANNQDEQKDKEEYKTLWGARILWPPDMPDDMLEDAVKFSQSALEEFGKQEREGTKIAQKIKQHLDENHKPYWHVTIGKNFGCHAVHEKQRFVYFCVDPFAFMIYKAQ